MALVIVTVIASPVLIALGAAFADAVGEARFRARMDSIREERL